MSNQIVKTEQEDRCEGCNSQQKIREKEKDIFLEDRWDDCFKQERFNSLVSCIEDLVQQPVPLYISQYSDLIQQLQDSLFQILRRGNKQSYFSTQLNDIFSNECSGLNTINYRSLSTPFSSLVQTHKDLDSSHLSNSPPSLVLNQSQELNYNMELDTPRSDISSIITSNSQSSSGLNLSSLNTNQVLQQYQNFKGSNIGQTCNSSFSSAQSDSSYSQQKRSSLLPIHLNIKDIWSVAIVCRDRQGNCVLHQLAQQGNVELMDFVNSSTQNILLEERNSEGDSPLLIAAKHGQNTVVLQLLEQGASKEAFNIYGVGLIHYLASNTQNDTFNFIVNKYELNINKISAQGNPLHFAVSEGNIEIVESLLGMGCEVNYMDIDGVTPLMAAIMAGKRDCAIQLLRQRLDPQSTYVPGTNMNVMHLCSELDQQDVCKEFLKLNNDMATEQCKQCYGGLKAIHIASLLDNIDMLDILWPISDMGQHTLESLKKEAENIQLIREKQFSRQQPDNL